MSASIVRKGLELVDPTFTLTEGKKKKKDVAVPQNYKVTKTVKNRRKKDVKVSLLQQNKKITVADIRKNKKSSEEILKENLKILKTVKASCALNLDEKLIEKIVLRAVTRKPVILNQNKKKETKTAFTEEDFAKFEKEYTGD